MDPEATKEVEDNVPPIPTIPQLFKGKCVLVTGATGFLGKVLVEKLLRSCPGIKELFILLRPSKKGDISNRLHEYTGNQVFKRLRNEQPDALNKIRPLTGDIKLDNLGLSGWQLRKVTSEVSFVFHCAANVRFDGDARETLSANLLGVHNALSLCRTCQQLEAFVHVSTAYSFCNNTEISENVYPELVKPEKIIETTKWMTDDQLRTLCMYYIKDRPAFYHFSKALAETLIVESELNFPAVIVRPSVVTASVKEPFPGWIDNYNGPSGFIYVSGQAIVRTLLVEPTVNADWVPVDIVANTLIVAAHYMAVKSKSKSSTVKLNTVGQVPIINCTCPENNQITWNKITKICIPLLIKYPSISVYGKPGGIVTPYSFVYATCRLFSHYLPAALMDACYCLTLSKPKFLRIYSKIHRVMSYLEYYTTHSFSFQSSNMGLLMEQMDPDDREVFHIDQSVLNWSQYLENYVLGVRRYFAKENDDTLPEARTRMMRLHYTWLAVKLSTWLGIFMLIKYLQQRGFIKGQLNFSFLLNTIRWK